MKTITIKLNEDDMEVDVPKGISGLEIINSILMLAHTLFTAEGFIKINTDDKITEVFNDLRIRYIKDFKESN